jgi:hypothetical protein
MKRRVRAQFWIETIAGTLTGVLFVVTMLWHDWIEDLVGWDPDQHSGAVEWLIVGGLAVITVVLFVAARAEWRRASLAVSGGSAS